jgi:hypothetical protein
MSVAGGLTPNLGVGEPVDFVGAGALAHSANCAPLLTRHLDSVHFSRDAAPLADYGEERARLPRGGRWGASAPRMKSRRGPTDEGPAVGRCRVGRPGHCDVVVAEKGLNTPLAYHPS